MSVSPCLDIHIHHVLVGSIKNKAFSIPVSFPIGPLDCESPKIIDSKALIDSGAGGKFIDQNYAKCLGLKQKKLKKPLPVFNVNRTPNKKKTVKVPLQVGDQIKKTILLVTGLEKQRIILGQPWLWKENSNIDWKKGTLAWRKEEPITIQCTNMEKEEDDQEWMNNTVNTLENSEYILDDIDSDEEETDNPVILSYIHGEPMDEQIWINAKLAPSQAFVQQYEELAPEEEQIPSEFHEYMDVFNEVKADRFPHLELGTTRLR